MGVVSNKISREEVKPGDHIYTWRTAFLYAHHGIYVGDGKVAHYTSGQKTKTGFGKILVSSSSNHASCPICKDGSSFEGIKVITSCLDCFLAGGKLYLYKYNVSRAYFLAKPRGGTCTLAPSDPPEAVLYRANFHLLIDGWFGNYDVTNNNCEDFAIYCKTGLLVCTKKRFGTSGQANSAAAASLGLVVVTSGLSMVGLGVYSYLRLAKDVSKKENAIKVSVEKLASILKSDSPREGWLSIAGSKFMGK